MEGKLSRIASTPSPLFLAAVASLFCAMSRDRGVFFLGDSMSFACSGFHFSMCVRCRSDEMLSSSAVGALFGHGNGRDSNMHYCNCIAMRFHSALIVSGRQRHSTPHIGSPLEYSFLN